MGEWQEAFDKQEKQIRQLQAENERLKKKIKQLEQDVKTAYGAFLK